MICSTTSSGVVLSHEGGVRRYGRADDAVRNQNSSAIVFYPSNVQMPFPGACIRPMLTLSKFQYESESPLLVRAHICVVEVLRNQKVLESPKIRSVESGRCREIVAESAVQLQTLIRHVEAEVCECY